MTQLCLLEDYRGRVLSLWTLLAMGAPAVGSALLGALTDVLGYTPVFAVVGGVGVGLVLLLYTRRSWLSDG